MKRWVQREYTRGQDLIEFALILPLLLLLLTGIMEFGLAIMAYNTVANAAREGARYGIVRVEAADCADDYAEHAAAIEDAARRLTVGLDQDRLDIVVSCPAARTLQVEATYVHQFITAPVLMALGGDGTLPMYTVSTMYLE